MDSFARQLLDWFDRHGRKDLPWQQDISAYRVWVSEIMLQQTQVTTVIPYYERFMARFPEVHSLANASIDEVLHLWTGLGYYARARNLHRTAGLIVTEHQGRFPKPVAELEKLPGIGRSTAGAIAAIAGNVHAPILDANVKRVLARYHAIDGYPGETATARRLWETAEAHTPAARVADYTQAIMDIGATVCTRTRPDCASCPFIETCAARLADSIADYPTRKPKTTKPVRAARIFLFHDAEGACLLEQRPPSGIWGGLWTPPERTADTLSTEAAQVLGFDSVDLLSERIAPAFRHTFTHFHLDIHPVYLRVNGPPQSLRDRDDLRWHAPGSGEPIGLSAAAQRLLSSLEAEVAIRS